MTKEYTRFGPTRHHRGQETCNIWAENYAILAFTLGGRPESLLHFSEALDRRVLLLDKRCEDCRRELGYWSHQFNRDIKELLKLSEWM